MFFITKFSKILPYLLIGQLLFTMLEFGHTTPPTRKFEQLTVYDGLSSNYTTSIVQDKKGFVWIGTSKGLNRFDGKNFKVFTHKEHIAGSLSDDHITSLLKDSKGNLWIGTSKGGICRYSDSDTFDCYKADDNNPNSISDNKIWTIFEDRQARLWIGTQNGLNLFDREKQSFINFLPDENDPSAIPGQAVLSLAQDSIGRLWVGTWAEGLALLNPSSSENMEETTFTPITPTTIPATSSISNIWIMEVDEMGRLWIGDRGDGLFMGKLPNCERNSCNAKEFKFHKILDQELFSSGIIEDFIIDSKNILWIGVLEGVYSFDIQQLKDIKWEDNLEGVLVDYKKRALSSLNVSINNIYEDENHLVWYASKKGVFKNLEYLKTFQSINSDINTNVNNSFTTFCQDKFNADLIWVGQVNTGLIVYSIKKDQFNIVETAALEKYNLTNISTIIQDQSGYLWVGTREGLILKIRLENSQILKIEEVEFLKDNKKLFSQVWNIEEDSKGDLIIATNRGVCIYHPKTKNIEWFSEYDDNKKTIIGHLIFDAIETSDNTYWLASAGGGLNKITWINGQPIFENYTASDSSYALKNNFLFDIHAVNNSLWIASQSGIQEFDINTNKFKENKILDNTISTQVLSITSDLNGNIWFLTEDQLHSYSTDLELLSTYSNIDGVVPNSSMPFRATSMLNDGRVLIGGANGFNLIDPQQMAKLSFNSKLLITDIKLFNESIPIGVKDPLSEMVILEQQVPSTKKFQLCYLHDFITFEFSTLDYVNSHRYQYAYQLDNFDENWIDVGNRNTISYTNLKPGNYTFKVKAKNNLGIWSTPTTIEFNITPPFWQTYPFFLLSSLGVIVSFLLIQASRERKIKKQNKALEYKIAKRTSELKNTVEELKKKEKVVVQKNIMLEKYIESNSQLENFAYIASHDLRSPLTTIISFVKLIKKSTASKLSEREKELFYYVSTSAKNMQELIDALLHYSRVNSQNRNIQTVNPQKIMELIQIDLQSTIKTEKATITISDFPESIQADRIKLKQLFQNLISNGIKFSKKEVNPTVSIHCDELNSHWKFKVVDNGIGIPEEFNQKIFQIFQRLHRNTEYVGTGIGLAVCKKIVEQHEGEIWVNSREGIGSEFFFTISKELRNELKLK